MGGCAAQNPYSYLVNRQFCELPKSYLRVYKQVKSIRLFNKGLTKVFLSEEGCGHCGGCNPFEGIGCFI